MLAALHAREVPLWQAVTNVMDVTLYTSCVMLAGVRRRFLPKTMEELNEHDEARQPLASREYASSDEAV